MLKKLSALVAGLYLSLSPVKTGAYDVNDNHLSDAVRDNINATTKKIVTIEFIKKEHRMELFGPGSSSRSYTGSAVTLCSKDGERYLLTAAHLLPMHNGYFIYAEEMGDIKGITKDFRFDLALLETEGKKGTCFDGKIGHEYKTGDFIVSTGYAGTGYLHYHHGTISGKLNPFLNDIDSHINRGDSGGPVIAFEHGEPRLIGIISMKDKIRDGSNYVITSETICNFLEESPVSHYCPSLKGKKGDKGGS